MTDESKSSSKRQTKQVEGDDGYLIVTAFIPGYEPFERKFKLTNIVGNTMPTERTPINIRMILYDAIRKAFGVKVE